MGTTFELTKPLLETVVRRLFNQKDATIAHFEIRALKPGVGNPTSLGVYRVTGEALFDKQSEPFSLVVKHLANGLPMMDTSAENHWNHWKREVRFFESELAARIPQSIAYPPYLGSSELADGTVLFWNGDLGDLTKAPWTWEACKVAAKAVAELNSIRHDDLDRFPWLNRTQVQGWDALRIEWNSFEPTFQVLKELVKRDPTSLEAFAVYSPWMNRHDFIGQLMAGGRQVFVHGDFNLNNLSPVAQGDAALTALDWQLAGVGRAGMEVAAIFGTAIERGVIEVDDHKFEELCRIYTARFNELNQDDPIELNEVRLAAAANGYFIVQGVGFFFNQIDPAASVADNEQRVLGLIHEFEHGACMVYSRVLHELAPQ